MLNMVCTIQKKGARQACKANSCAPLFRRIGSDARLLARCTHAPIHSHMHAYRYNMDGEIMESLVMELKDAGAKVCVETFV